MRLTIIQKILKILNKMNNTIKMIKMGIKYKKTKIYKLKFNHKIQSLRLEYKISNNKLKKVKNCKYKYHSKK